MTHQRDTDPYLRFLLKPSSRRFAAFVRAYLGVVRRLAGNIAADDSMADEITQEVLLKLGRNRTPPGEIRNPRAYILRCVLNEYRSLVRRESARSRHERKAGMAQACRVETSPEEKLESREVLERTVSALAELPQDFRVPLHLWAVEGLSYDEISDVTGVDRDTIGTRIHRAREKLREVLGLASLSLVFSAIAEAREQRLLPGLDSRLLDQVIFAHRSDGLRLEAARRGSPRRARRRTLLVGGASAFLALALVWLGFLATHLGRRMPDGVVRETAVPRQGPSLPELPSDEVDPELRSEMPADSTATLCIKGRVVDGETGDPVAGQEILANLGEWDCADFIRGRTDGGGRFEVRALDRAPEGFRLTVGHFQSRYFAVPAALVSGREEEWDLGDIELLQGTRITFIVHDAEGRAISGAEVREDGFRPGQRGRSGRTDARGIWASGGYPHRDKVSFFVSADAYAPRAIEVPVHGQTNWFVELERAAVVSGRIVDADGVGVPRMQVHLQARSSSAHDAARILGYHMRLKTEADAEGSYSLAVPAGRTLQLACAACAFGPWLVSPLAPGEHRTLEPSCIGAAQRLKVLALDTEGKPLSGCRLFYAGRYWFCDRNGSLEITLRDGVRDAPTIADRRFCSSETLSLEEMRKRIEPKGPLPTLTLRARRGPWLEGTVSEMGGTVLRQGYVILGGRGLRFRPSSTIGSNGRYAFRAVPPTPFPILVSSYQVHLESEVVEIPAGGVLDWELPAEGATRLEAELLDAEGRSAGEGPFHALVLIDDKRNFRWCSSTPGKGPIVFSTFGREIESYTGTPEVAIVADGRGVSVPQPVERLQKPWVHLKAHLRPFARIEGRVVSGEGEGEPVAGATVVVDCTPFDTTARSTSLRRMTASDLEGRFQLVDLIPGRYILWAHAPGAAGTLSEPVAVDFEEKRELTIRLTPGGAVRGRVEDRGGSPVDGAAIWFRFGLFDDSQNLSRPHCFTDPAGVFFFDGLPPGLPIQGHVCGVNRDGQSVEDHVFHVQAKEGENVDVVVRIP